MDYSELTTILKAQLQLSKPKLTCLCELILTLIMFRTVSLPELAAGLSGDTLLASKHRRIQRLISSWPKELDWLGPWLLSWFFEPDEKLQLTLDRTTWYVGKQLVDFMVVGVVYKKMAIPIMFSFDQEKAMSSQFDRIYLMERVLKYIPSERIESLLGDREFIGERWFGWLKDHGISFHIRIKSNLIATNSTGQEVVVSWLFNQLKPGERLKIHGPRHILGHQLFLTGGRSAEGELMIIASDLDDGCAIEIYLKRWEIESLFENLKSRGFNLACSRMTNAHHLKALFQILMLASCWCLRCGDWAIENVKKIALKNHGRPSNSTFRYGLDQIRQAISRRFSQVQEQHLAQLWHLLTPPRILVRL